MYKRAGEGLLTTACDRTRGNAWITKIRISSEQTADDFWVSLVWSGSAEVTKNGKWCGIRWMSLALMRRAEGVSSAGGMVWLLCWQRVHHSSGGGLYRERSQGFILTPAGSKGLQAKLWVWLICSGPQAVCSLSPLYLMEGKIFSSLGKYISLCWAALVPGIISANSKESCAEKGKSLGSGVWSRLRQLASSKALQKPLWTYAQ